MWPVVLIVGCGVENNGASLPNFQVNYQKCKGEGETSCHDTCFDLAQGSCQMAYHSEFV